MISRRQLAAALAAFAWLPFGAAHAQGFPNRPVRIVVPFAAGGTGDVLMRSLQEPLQRHLVKALGMSPHPGNAAAFGEIIRADQQLWTQVVQQGKIEPE